MENVYDSFQKSSTTVFNIDIKNVSWAPNQHVQIISEAIISDVTLKTVVNTKNSAWHHRNKLHVENVIRNKYKIELCYILNNCKWLFTAFWRI